MATVLKKNNKKLFLSLLPLLLIIGALSIYSWMTPQTTTVQLVDSTSNIETAFAYKATMSPNILYPEGGTVDVGDTLFKKITAAIPLDLKTIIKSEEEVLAKGTYDIQLIVKAGDIWQRTYPLQSKQTFEQKGKDISVIDNVYKIDLTQLNAFITQVEEETGVRQSQYDLEVVPTIHGVIQYADMERELQVQDKLIFHYLYDEIKLASEKSFTTAVQFNESETTANPFSLLELTLPLITVRITTTVLSVILLLSIIFSFKYLDTGRVRPVKSESEKLNKKYGSRMIRISQLIDFTGKTVIPFDTFKSLLKIADEKEQPIFFYENGNDRSQLYLIVDGAYVYTFEPRTDAPTVPNKETGNGKAYVVG
ncbi:DUF5305 family protein [Sporosarcina sp. 179-K 8C2 HS]|uniref:DUF5305 family protein n=1 Tax=Sporosarcina sp. 179-K 8C2 HS TaxID=3142387 RepID=UPI00399F9CF9